MDFVERILRTPSVPHYLEHRVIGQSWYYIIEDYHTDVPQGTRFLVRRHHEASTRGRTLITDYITMRIERNGILGWEHITARYHQGEASPFGYDYDGPMDRQPRLPLLSASPAPPPSPVLIGGYRASDFATH